MIRRLDQSVVLHRRWNPRLPCPVAAWLFGKRRAEAKDEVAKHLDARIRVVGTADEVENAYGGSVGDGLKEYTGDLNSL